MKNFNNFQSALEVLSAKNTLVQLAKEAGATVSFFDGTTCVNGSFPTGSFVCTACTETLLENIIYVTNWIAEYAYPQVGSLQRWLADYEEDPEYWYEYFIFKNHTEEEALTILYGASIDHECVLDDPEDEHYERLAEMSWA